MIERHVETLHGIIGGPTSVVDLGCGPGLYTAALASRGHTCLGIDIGPASIAHANENSGERYAHVLGDVRTADPGTGHGLAMMLFGQIDTFSPVDVALILHRMRGALRDDGVIVLEVHDTAHVATVGRSGTSWWTADGGLFADGPHLVLQEQRWVDSAGFADSRHLVISGEETTEYLHRTYAADADQWAERLAEAGFCDVADLGPFTGEAIDSAFRVITARCDG